jgi:hypothetical protein
MTSEEDRTTFFDVWGPFEVGHSRTGWIEQRQDELWAAVEDRCEGLSGAIGCYLFCLKTPRRLVPWYVGMTVSEKGFRGECFQLHKLQAFNDVMMNHSTPQARPVLFFFPLMTPASAFSRAGVSGRPLILWLERYLMMTAYARNAAIRNVRDMTLLRRVEVLGVLGVRRGRPHADVQQVRRALFGTTRRPSTRG